jgi:phosphatidylglycerol---prolipoprotein diacylglyceryl transferase
MTIGYVIWDTRPQLIDFGSFEIRYYSLLFALGFVTGYIILSRIFKKKGLSQELLDRLTVYMVLSTIVGARLGHCLFYEFPYYSHHPLEIILPFRGKMGTDFEFTGYQGLASHGAAIGIIAGILLFARKTKSSFLWTMDMIVMVTALAGCFIRLGNLMNSEIYGNPTKSTHGFVFTHDLTRLLTEKYPGTVDYVDYEKIKEVPVSPAKSVPVQMNVHFNRKIRDEKSVNEFGKVFLPADLRRYNFDNNILPPGTDSVSFDISQKNKLFVLSARIDAVPRYPTQIYEAMSYLFIFFLLLLIYYKLDIRLREGFIFGMFLFLVFSARFFIEFIKQNQESFEDSLALNMGQILSIPLVVGGLVLIFLKWPKNEPQTS